jgi:hypothetical protein
MIFDHMHRFAPGGLDTFRTELDTFVRFLLPGGSNFSMTPCIRSAVLAAWK